MRHHRLVLLLVSFVLTASFAFTGHVTAQGDTFSLGAEVRLCDYTQSDPIVDPEEWGPSAYCQIPVDGAAITLVSADGEVLDTCTTTVHDGPQGGYSSSCSVDGLSYNASFTFELDEASIPGGYEIEENPLTIQIDDVIPGGGESFPVSFRGAIGSPDDIPTGDGGGNGNGNGSGPGTGNGDGSGQGRQHEYTAAIASGTCAEPGATVEDLAPVVVESGTAVGSDLARGPWVSQTTVAINLDTLIDEPHILLVNDVESPMLCGAIGGVDNDDGTLYILLANTVNGANTRGGVAALSYNADDPAATDVTVFVVPVD